ncbi:OsmC family peroxiredoxin [Pseudobdellovibrio exovorus]|uniref:Osmotically inducible protein OsmC n=1 Tax=Pseudobdellovibrio exovorus JSS TaxID=1184267 RepID=M4VDY1_9BACT|nr:OsmC family peroxiredoxin [Pseudobdellovibrio exovorus]AGH96700.1 hypothetical protein A11Q_2484 [Pseudobdellovibrio exovorus JSS]
MNTMKSRSASVSWKGSLKDGGGKVSTESGALRNLSYAFNTRFDNETGTNPEELISAALASCFTMAVSAELQKQHLVADALEVEATTYLDRSSTGAWFIPEIFLEVSGIVPGCNKAQFDKATMNAKMNCPVSQLLNADVTMEAHLMSPPLQSLDAGPV